MPEVVWERIHLQKIIFQNYHFISTKQRRILARPFFNDWTKKLFSVVDGICSQVTAKHIPFEMCNFGIVSVIVSVSGTRWKEQKKKFAERMSIRKINEQAYKVYTVYEPKSKPAKEREAGREI